MLTQTSKNQNRRHVHTRIRKKIQGTAERPRLNLPKARRAKAAPAETWLQRSRWARQLRSARKKRASAKSYSIAADTFITGGLRPWRKRRAKRDYSSRRI